MVSEWYRRRSDQIRLFTNEDRIGLSAHRPRLGHKIVWPLLAECCTAFHVQRGETCRLLFRWDHWQRAGLEDAYRLP